MNIEIKELTPDLTEDYLNFFDTVPHMEPNSDAPLDDPCYCVCWCNKNCDGEDHSTGNKRRIAAEKYVKDGNIKGYLAYCDNKVIGWCNANTKSDCYECFSWKMFMGAIDRDGESPNIKVKSIFCYTIAPEFRKKGIAGLLCERVCADAKKDGFDFVEAYPNKKFINLEEDFMGPVKLYEKHGFTAVYETSDKAVMRKRLKT